MAENLNIKVNTAAARKQIIELNTAVKTLGQTLSSFGTKGAKFKQIVTGIAAIKPVNPEVAKSLNALSVATNKLAGSQGLERVKTSIQSVGKLRVAGTTKSIQSLAAAVNKLGATGGMAKAAAGATKLTSSLSKVKSAATSSISGMRGMGSAAAGATSSLNSMLGKAAAAAANMRKLAAAESVTIGKTQQLKNVTVGLGNALNAMRGSLAVQGIVNFGKAVFQAGTAFQQFELAMNTISAVGTTLKDITADVHAMANATATDVRVVAQNFSQFGIASKLAGTSVAEARDIFQSFSGALRVMGKGADAAKGTFLALTQMVSKGTIQSEELRRQLAEHLPGAFELFAQAAGVSSAALQDMMKKGLALTKDILPKAAALIEARFGPALAAALETPAAKMTLLGNKAQEMMDKIARGSDGISGSFSGLTSLLDSMIGLMNSDAANSFALALGAIASVSFEVLAAGFRAFTTLLTLATDTVKVLGVAYTNLVSMFGGSEVDAAGVSFSTLSDSISKLVGFTVDLGAAMRVALTAMAIPVVLGMVVAVGKLAFSLASMGVSALASFGSATAGALGFSAAANVATVSMSRLKIAMIASGFGIAVVAVGFLVSKFLEWNTASSQANAKVTQTAAALAAANPKLKKYGEVIKESATASGLSAAEVNKLVEASIKLAATTDDQITLINKEVDAINKKLEAQAAALIKDQAMVAFLEKKKASAVGLNTAEQHLLDTTKKSTEARAATITATLQARDAQNALKTTIEGMQAAEEAKNVATGDGVVKSQELTTAVKASTKALADGKTTTTEVIAKIQALRVTNGEVVTSIDTVTKTIAKIKPAADEASVGIGKFSSRVGDELGKTSSFLDKAIAKFKELFSAREEIKGGSGGSGGGSSSAGRTAKTNSSTFSGNVPHLSGGTANTNSFTKRSAGGIPAILHPNEAVVPLSGGRSIPVQINAPSASQHRSDANEKNTKAQRAETTETRTTDKVNIQPSKQDISVVMNINTLDVDSFQKSENQILRDFAVKMGEAIQQYG